MSGGELREVFVHHLLGSVFSENGVDEGVVDVTEDRDGSIDLGELCVASQRVVARRKGKSVPSIATMAAVKDMPAPP